MAEREAPYSSRRWGVALTAFLAAVGGFDVAAGVWHHADPVTFAAGILCLIVALGRCALDG